MAQRRVLGPSQRDLAPTERVGFDTLADQYVNRQQQLGFRFNLLCVGETAIGKASLLDSLFDQAFKLPSHDHQEPNVSVETTETKVEEGGTEILLRLSTTVGYGDQISRAATIEPIVEFLDKQFEAHFQEEIKTQRDLAQHEDTRVHACLFMLAPTGHTLKSLDLEVLRALHEKVNVIPVIAKADTLSPDELANFKHTLRQEFQANNIRTFDFDIGSQAVPLGVVGSKDVVTVGGISSRVRQYPWGVVEVENEQHSDFMKLRRLLFQTCMETLRHKTHMVHYEKYRHDKLGALGLGGSAGDDENQPSTIADAVIAAKKQMEAELKLLEQSKMDRLKSEVTAKEAELERRNRALEEQREVVDKLQRELDMLDQEESNVDNALRDLQDAIDREAQEAASKGKKKKDKKSDKH